MEIDEKNKKMCSISAINIGETFVYEQEIFIKLDGSTKDDCKAANLRTGTTCTLTATTPVQKKKYKVVPSEG